MLLVELPPQPKERLAQGLTIEKRSKNLSAQVAANSAGVLHSVPTTPRAPFAMKYGTKPS